MTERAATDRKPTTEQRQRFGNSTWSKSSGCTGWEYIIEYVDHQLIEDRVINDNGITLFIDPKEFGNVNGSQLIFKEEGINCGIEIMNPNSTSTCGCGESFAV